MLVACVGLCPRCVIEVCVCRLCVVVCVRRVVCACLFSVMLCVLVVLSLRVCVCLWCCLFCWLCFEVCD